MKKEFEIEDDWVSFEIHPDTPREGKQLKDVFPAASVEQMYRRLNETGKAFGLSFGQMNLLSNSRMALMASEFARDNGVFHDFHKRIFDAYFARGEDIGNVDVLLQLAKQSGLVVDELQEALTDQRYLPRLEQAQREGAQYGVTGTPTFIINGRYKVVGAQPIEAFRNALIEIASKGK